MIEIRYDEKENVMHAKFNVRKNSTAAEMAEVVIGIIVGLVDAYKDATDERGKEILVREIENIRQYIDNTEIEDVHSGE